MKLVVAVSGPRGRAAPLRQTRSPGLRLCPSPRFQLRLRLFSRRLCSRHFKALPSGATGRAPPKET